MYSTQREKGLLKNSVFFNSPSKIQVRLLSFLRDVGRFVCFHLSNFSIFPVENGDAVPSSCDYPEFSGLTRFVRQPFFRSVNL